MTRHLANVPIQPAGRDAMLDALQRDAFSYFLHETNPANGLVADKTEPGAPASIAAVGFALAVYPVGVERSWMTRTEAVARTLAALRFFWNSPQGTAPDATGHKGFYYHFLDMQTGRRAGRCDLSTVDTAFLLAGMLTAADPIKATTAEAVKDLHALGLKLVMLTGDNRRTAAAVARQLGLDAVEAEIEPAGKVAQVKKLRAEGQHVAMAGDGINDAPALSEADVGIAMGTGTDVAMQSAGITLVKGDLRGIAKAIRLSRATMRNIRQNLFFAFLYNALGIPVAAGVLYPFFGLLLSPIIAGAAMSLSSVSVISNALRLRSVKL